ncbi:TetR/AcrR family transcriptional regulator [Nonomuraea sp. KC401]|uniref:TetR/AcrR family transcriptional regulator n=1 Tax=unclassified Nonomuraea TaxID=2593643 RepID=UPI0010FCF726|nr:MULTISPECIES: TetR/AcrR family transcriptional regulator [unclassified Nonomuraea]NBE93961.1 TetR family transcriptional regulator [Nonomuraea sp. K271]TLF80214.1 TetR/AcrR family transcriptional regulator [Nonomuraea sp. KC401]
MCSASPDLTAQAKIRNAAIAHFAKDGFQKANLRAVAATAGVSPGLVIHHFGSKEKLRSVCDDHVLRILIQRADNARPSGMQDLFREYLSNPEEYRLQVQYMLRAIEEDTPAAATFVDTLVAESEEILRAGIADGSMRPSSDVRALAVLTVLNSVATLTMPPPLARALGYERFGPDLLRRLALPTLELYTHGLFTNDTALKAARTALDESPQKRD